MSTNNSKKWEALFVDEFWKWKDRKKAEVVFSSTFTNLWSVSNNTRSFSSEAKKVLSENGSELLFKSLDAGESLVEKWSFVVQGQQFFASDRSRKGSLKRLARRGSFVSCFYSFRFSILVWSIGNFFRHDLFDDRRNSFRFTMNKFSVIFILRHVDRFKEELCLHTKIIKSRYDTFDRLELNKLTRQVESVKWYIKWKHFFYHLRRQINTWTTKRS